MEVYAYKVKEKGVIEVPAEMLKTAGFEEDKELEIEIKGNEITIRKK